MDKNLIINRISQVVGSVSGKFRSYPNINKDVYYSWFNKISRSFSNLRELDLGDAFQEIRAVSVCPESELCVSTPETLPECSKRLIFILDVIRRACNLSVDEYKELITYHISWEPKDQQIIFDEYKRIVI